VDGTQTEIYLYDISQWNQLRESLQQGHEIMVRLILCCMLLGTASCSKQTGDRMPNYMKSWDGKYPEVSYIDMPPVEKLSGLKAVAYSGSGPAVLSVSVRPPHILSCGNR
jgi:hypothetical protein